VGERRGIYAYIGRGKKKEKRGKIIKKSKNGALKYYFTEKGGAPTGKRRRR